MVVVPAEFSEMVTASDLVVHGRVVAIRPQIVGDRRTIETVITVAVVDALKGQPGETVYFRVPGGQVGRYRRLMVGAPEFAEGEEVVLFLKGRAPACAVPIRPEPGRVSRRARPPARVSSPRRRCRRRRAAWCAAIRPDARLSFGVRTQRPRDCGAQR